MPTLKGRKSKIFAGERLHLLVDIDNLVIEGSTTKNDSNGELSVLQMGNNYQAHSNW